MKIPKNVNVVNDSYRTLSERAIMLRNTLEKLGYNVEWGYYDRHTVTVNGDNFLEYYPIPVLTVNGICDIAVAVGAFYRPDENKIISIGGSFGGGENMISAGISVKVGQGTGISASKAAMANEIRELKARDREREAQMQEIMRQLEILQKQAGK